MNIQKFLRTHGLKQSELARRIEMSEGLLRYHIKMGIDEKLDKKIRIALLRWSKEIATGIPKSKSGFTF